MSLLSQNTFRRHNLALDVGTAGIRVGTGVHRLIEQPSVPTAPIGIFTPEVGTS